MKRTVHLLDCESPIVEGSDLAVNCGITLKNAVAVFMFTDELGEYMSKIPGLCRKCDRAEVPVAEIPAGEVSVIKGKHYLYGLCAGEEIKQELGDLE